MKEYADSCEEKLINGGIVGTSVFLVVASSELSHEGAVDQSRLDIEAAREQVQLKTPGAKQQLKTLQAEQPQHLSDAQTVEYLVEGMAGGFALGVMATIAWRRAENLLKQRRIKSPYSA